MHDLAHAVDHVVELLRRARKPGTRFRIVKDTGLTVEEFVGLL